MGKNPPIKVALPDPELSPMPTTLNYSVAHLTEFTSELSAQLSRSEATSSKREWFCPRPSQCEEDAGDRTRVLLAKSRC